MIWWLATDVCLFVTLILQSGIGRNGVCWGGGRGGHKVLKRVVRHIGFFFKHRQLVGLFWFFKLLFLINFIFSTLFVVPHTSLSLIHSDNCGAFFRCWFVCIFDIPSFHLPSFPILPPSPTPSPIHLSLAPISSSYFPWTKVVVLVWGWGGGGRTIMCVSLCFIWKISKTCHGGASSWSGVACTKTGLQSWCQSHSESLQNQNMTVFAVLSELWFFCNQT